MSSVFPSGKITHFFIPMTIFDDARCYLAYNIGHRMHSRGTLVGKVLPCLQIQFLLGMKRLITLVIFCLSVDCAFGQTLTEIDRTTSADTMQTPAASGQTISGTCKTLTDRCSGKVRRYVYCQILGSQSLFSQLNIIIDLGQETKLLSTRNSLLVDKDNKPIYFNSMVDAMNYMGNFGWEFVQAYTLTNDGDTQYVYWVLRKDVTDAPDVNSAMYEGLRLSK